MIGIGCSLGTFLTGDVGLADRLDAAFDSHLTAGASGQAAWATQILDPIDTDQAITRTQDYLFSIQNSDGHWRARLEGDSILESEYVLLMLALSYTLSGVIIPSVRHFRRPQPAS